MMCVLGLLRNDIVIFVWGPIKYTYFITFILHADSVLDLKF